jgi:hypothetical protein
VGPSRLASATYTRLAAGLAAYVALTAAGLALAAPRLALAPAYRVAAAVGLAGLAADTEREDGVDLLPLLAGRVSSPERSLFWRHAGRGGGDPAAAGSP